MLDDDLGTCDLLEGTVLLTKISETYGMMEGVVGGIVVGVGATWVESRGGGGGGSRRKIPLLEEDWLWLHLYSCYIELSLHSVVIGAGQTCEG